MHPDKVQAAGLQERLAHLASEQIQRIVAAFREYCRRIQGI
jgi:DnaJ-domain-containing protein 1